MVYSQLAFINEGSAKILVIFVWDFDLLNLVNLADKYENISIFLPSSPSVLDKFAKWKS